VKKNKKQVAKLPVFQALKNGLVGDVARLLFGQFLYSNRTNLLRSQQHQHRCAKQNRKVFRYVLMQNEQTQNGKKGLLVT
jgi:hypothetical protein